MAVMMFYVTVTVIATAVAVVINIVTTVTSDIVVFSGLQFGFGRRRSGSSGPGGRKTPTLLTPGHRQNLPTGGARRVGPKPRVDAGNVEAVAALRQHADLVAGGEVGEADRAFRCRHPLAGVAVHVRELRQRLQHLLL